MQNGVSERLCTRPEEYSYLRRSKKDAAYCVVISGLVWLGWVASVQARSIPVYRYALERWEADLYRVVIFYEKELPAESTATLGPVVNAGARIYGPVPESVKVQPQAVKANVSVHFVNLADHPDPQMLEWWQAQKGRTLPWVLIRFPATAQLPLVLWQGPLEAAAGADRGGVAGPPRNRATSDPGADRGLGLAGSR